MSLAEFGLLVVTFNAIAMGNGPVMVPLFRPSLTEERGVLTLEQLLYAFAIGQVTPGQTNLYAAALGYMLLGGWGALVAVVALVVPACVIIPLARGYERLSRYPLLAAVTRGMTSASVGLILAATWSIGQQTLTTLTAWIVVLLTAGLTYLARWPALLSLLIASAAGALLLFLTSGPGALSR
jgi:chromate transporter